MENAITTANTHAALVDLTEQTGGFLITDSSKRMLSRIMNDAESRYELTYSPAWEIYDGRFHKIEVKPAREGLTVEARPGYYPCRDGRWQPHHSRGDGASASSTHALATRVRLSPRRSTSDRRRVPPSSRWPWRSPGQPGSHSEPRKRSSGCMPRC